jgi:hypothetical protein
VPELLQAARSPRSATAPVRRETEGIRHPDARRKKTGDRPGGRPPSFKLT